MRALKTGLFAALTVVAIAATTTTGCSNASQVRQVFTALDGTGERPRNKFATDTSQIFCDVVFSAYSTDETLDVTWQQVTGEQSLFDGTDDLHPVARNWGGSEGVPTQGVSTVSFPFQRPTAVNGGSTVPFPVGHWKCVVTVNGDPGGGAEFDVVYPDQLAANTPDCPATGGVYSTMNCAAYKAGAQCPNDSNTASMCTCQSASDVSDPSTRAWVCP
jgi:hypothetical protein